MIISKYAWKEPRTDWKISYDSDGNYTGDTFEPDDYNRIKNNINYLRDFAHQIYDNNPVCNDLGADVFYGSENELKASWWTEMQDNLERINQASVETDIGTREQYSSNTAGKLVDELNRLEQSSLDIYTKLSLIRQNKPKLSIRLGCWKGVKC
ncbi:MAG: hypothetical protein PHY47_15955 [Lachnospiraceae bacterium]|nr:hypothetical protein [Lachnospiraceae bacterium]